MQLYYVRKYEYDLVLKSQPATYKNLGVPDLLYKKCVVHNIKHERAELLADFAWPVYFFLSVFIF